MTRARSKPVFRIGTQPARVRGTATHNLLLVLALAAIAVLIARLLASSASSGEALTPLDAAPDARAAASAPLSTPSAGALLEPDSNGRTEGVPIGVRLTGVGRLEGQVIERASSRGVGGVRVDLLPVPPAGATLLARMLRIASSAEGIEDRVRPIAVAQTEPDGLFVFEGVRTGTWFVDATGASDDQGLVEIGRHLPGEYRLLVQHGFARVEAGARVGANADEVELRAQLP